MKPSTARVGILSREFKLPMSGAMLGILLAIVLLAFEQRYQAIDKTVVENPLRGDAFRYFVIAHNINNYGVYSSDEGGLRGAEYVHPDAVISPGYPLFMSAFLRDREQESDFQQLLMAQALLGTLTVLITFFIARLMLPLWATSVAMLLTAVSPHLVSLTTYFLTETLFGFLLALAILFTQLSFKRRSLWLGTGAGLLFAAASLTRPSLQYFAPFLFLAVLSVRSLPRVPAIALLSAFIVGMSPWWIRNYIVIGSTSDSTLMASTLNQGGYPNLMFEGRPETYGYPYRYDPQASQAGSSVFSALTAIKRRFDDNPREMVAWYLFGKPSTFWRWGLTESIGDVFVYPTVDSPYFRLPHFVALHTGMRALHPLLVAFGIGGALLALALTWHGRNDGLIRSDIVAAFVIATLLIYMVALHMVVAPFPRYSIPLRPYLFTAALFILISIARAAKQMRAKAAHN